MKDPTLAAADRIFSQFAAEQAALAAELPQRKSKLTNSVTAPNLSSAANPLGPTDGNADASKRYVHKEPTEVILRGFKSTQQYAAIREYERIAGRICEDYPRDPPLEQRKYKADLRDPAALRKKAMTQEEKAKALHFAGGENWIKITFESHEAAEVAIENSPQTILGHIVSAELYRGVPPTADIEELANDVPRTPRGTPRADRFNRGTGSLPRSFSNSGLGRGTSLSPMSPTGSQYSSQTLDTGTLSTATASSATITSHNNRQNENAQDPSDIFCRRIPTAKKIQLLPAELALLPQPSYSKRLLSQIPLIGWLNSDMIGTQVPKMENGEFDWKMASLYWRFMYTIDRWTGWFDLMADKDD